MEKRGIVITPQIKEIHGGFQGGEIINPGILRQYLVYWDEIVIVNLLNPISSFGIESFASENSDVRIALEAELFKIANIGVDGKFIWSSGEIPEYFRLAQQQIANELSSDNDEYWTIGQSIKRLYPPKGTYVEQEVLVSKLINALPVPDVDISVERIIDFRRKRYDEFHAFRNAFDNLYLSIINSHDQKLALQIAIGNISKSISDIHKLMSESRFKPRFMTVDTTWNIAIDSMTKAIAVGAVLGDNTAVPILVGTINAAFKFKRMVYKKPLELPPNVKDIEYLYYVEKELKD